MANSKLETSAKARDAISESDVSEVYEDISLDFADAIDKPDEAIGGKDTHEMRIEQNDDIKEDFSSDGEKGTKEKHLVNKNNGTSKEDESDCEPGRDSVSSYEGGNVAVKERPAEKSTKSYMKPIRNLAQEGGSRASRTFSDQQELNKSKPRSVRGTPRNASKSIRGGSGAKSKPHADNRPKNTKSSTKSSSEQSGSDDRPSEEVKETDLLEDEPNGTASIGTDDEANDVEDHALDENKVICTANHVQKIEEMEVKMEKLEEELRETALLEVALYSVVAEHGSSAHKVHAPARRLSRMYIHACKHWSAESKGTVAKSAVSGLVLIAKACGNDVPRLTFWLSNTVVLREIICQAFGSSYISTLAGRYIEANGGLKKSSPLSWKGNNRQGKKLSFSQFVDDWQETGTFISALEKIEAWIFSRIIESVWWQTLTPHMQLLPQRSNSGKEFTKLQGPALGDQQQGSFSIELWEQAFFDASQRLCPVRAGGHECGCLPVLARMVMEQCVARLDVAMFNAILRQSENEIPTDPVSDPITNSDVLPIPAGDLSFGSGAQLKNAVGHWSRWLTDLFGMDAGDSDKDAISENDDDRKDSNEASKCFPLLNALSDLLMLPKDMLMDKAIRKEVCPMFGLSLLKRILCNFTPDEFCPDPVPGILLEVLNSESIVDRRSSDKDLISLFPCTAAPVVYRPPPSSCIAEKAADVVMQVPMARSASMIQRKGHTSDEELEELDDPLACIIENVPRSPSVSNGKQNGVTPNNSMFKRYDLLRQVWSAGV
ncbi:uncharacterized protein LOC116255776 isoform X1 [Nymphaea colorata]|nr:uncharacterized protein LOC116255776 isoform X1 [Nymphaea colorata]XP_031487629.1 uncharacterized protein LOC116255776 isoform X1 [Nymphaea colorata]